MLSQNAARLISRQLQSRCLPLQRNWAKQQRCCSQRTTAAPSSTAASKSSATDEISNEPIQFFGSQAATWRAKDTRSGGADEALWYQPYVISASLVAFMLYFCVLREESDIDRKLEGNLFDHVSGLEEIQLTVNYKYNKENGLDTKDIEQRLTDLGIDVKQLETNRLAAS